MLRVSEEDLDAMEEKYEGIKKLILDYESRNNPACPHCQSKDTAFVTVGLVGRSMSLAGATTKCKLLANGPRKGEYYCNACEAYFGELSHPEAPTGFLLKPNRELTGQAFVDDVAGRIIEAMTGKKPSAESLDAIREKVDGQESEDEGQ